LLGVIHSAGKSAANTDDGNRFGARLLRYLQTRRKIVNFAERIGNDRAGTIRLGVCQLD